MREDQPSAEGLLGSLEYEVMQCLWAGAPKNVSAVLADLNATRAAGDALAYTTVMTVLARLYDKGYLTREQRGRGYDYAPAFTEVELVGHLGKRDVEQLLARYGPVALAQFAAALDGADPALLERLRREAGADDA